MGWNKIFVYNLFYEYHITIFSKEGFRYIYRLQWIDNRIKKFSFETNMATGTMATEKTFENPQKQVTEEIHRKVNLIFIQTVWLYTRKMDLKLKYYPNDHLKV